MELGLGFADDDLREDKREVKQCLSSYNAKICHPKWFLTAEGDDNESRANIKKYQADYYYGNQKYLEAAQCYIEAITFLSSQNRIMRKDMMESLSRCYSYLGDEEKALQIISDLISDATTTDNMVQVLQLKQQILEKFQRVQDEIEVIQQLVDYHPYNAQFWLMLMRAYRRLLSTHCSKDEHEAVYNSELSVASVNTGGSRRTLEDEHGRCLTLTDSGSEKTARMDNVEDSVIMEAHENTSKGKMTHKLSDCDTPGNSVLDFDRISQEKSVPCEEKKVPLDDSHSCELCSCKDKQVSRLQTGISGHTCGLYSSSKTACILQLKLLTCCIRTRLLFRSVHGTVGSFIKEKNQESLTQVDKELESLCLEESVVQAATEYLMKDFCQTNELEEDENSDLRTQSDSKINAGAAADFDGKWFAWIKNI